jgi:Fur family ferric uptake transcriptional regulator
VEKNGWPKTGSFFVGPKPKKAPQDRARQAVQKEYRMRNPYNTQQREQLTAFLAKTNGAHLTAVQIARALHEQGTPMAKTTIYRQLNRMLSSGELRRLPTGSREPDCYQYVENSARCNDHLHLRCDACGELRHVECSELNAIAKHFAAHHSFTLNPAGTVFTGRCAKCNDSIGS